VDNGLTVTDLKSCLVWEMKDGADGAVNLADPHDVDNEYYWGGEGFLPQLNTGAGFAGRNDWRLPTSAGNPSYPTDQPAELESILETDHGDPTINPIFGPTASSYYWSASVNSSIPFLAWAIPFCNCNVLNDDLYHYHYVRALRGGP
jgi:hypothetical protein